MKNEKRRRMTKGTVESVEGLAVAADRILDAIFARGLGSNAGAEALAIRCADSLIEQAYREQAYRHWPETGEMTYLGFVAARVAKIHSDWPREWGPHEVEHRKAMLKDPES